MRNAFPGLALSLALAAVSGAGQAAPGPSAAVAHGAQLAGRCAACHAVGAEGASRNSSAPAFRTLPSGYNQLGLEQAIKRVARFGHFEMRPQQLSDSDADDLAAYIATLAPPKRQ